MRCGEGFAFAAADPGSAWSAETDRRARCKAPATVDMRGKLGTAFEVSADGRKVRFGLGSGETKPVLFDLATATLADSAKRRPVSAGAGRGNRGQGLV